MLISASYKTDIPAFYGEWFINRLRAGYCLMVHPYDRRRVFRVSLSKEDVDGIVFWTKNLGPFLHCLSEVAERGFPFVVQYTINSYPRKLEFSVTDPVRSLRHVERVASQFGPNIIVWRYDPVIFSSETPPDLHIENFTWLASRLSGMTDEVVISFAQIYKKTKRNMDWAAREFDFTWQDPDDDAKRDLARELLKIARRNRMRLTLCSQPYLLDEEIEEAHCIDAQRFSRLIGAPLKAELRGARKECGCYASRDIGEYDTCPHGCVYCYAVLNRKLSQKRYKAHDPNGEFLFMPTGKLPDPFEEDGLLFPKG
jgi:hypothetical protein